MGDLKIKQVSQEIIKENIKQNGEDICKYYFIEESAELTKELTKAMRGRENRDDIIKEVADVYYTLSMIVQEYGISDKEINECIEYKELRAEKELGI